MLLSLMKAFVISLTICSFVSSYSTCPGNFTAIGAGCYKVYNGSNMTWTAARDLCQNESSAFTTSSEIITHLVAIEHEHEKKFLFHWFKAYSIERGFWTDGILSTNSWNWSRTLISWFYNDTELNVRGNGSNFKYSYSQTENLYQITDDNDGNPSNFICEIQEPCNGTNPCQNNGECYMNIGYEICVCPEGFLGEYCQIELNECLPAPCEHGGICIDEENNYTCNCSETTFIGDRCEIQLPDPKAHNRVVAFWCVVGFACAAIVLLTITDLPLADICLVLGCSSKCCSKANQVEKAQTKRIDLSNVRPTVSSLNVPPSSIAEERPERKEPNYQVTCKVWNPSKKCYESATNPLPPQHTTFKQLPIHTLTSAIIKSQPRKYPSIPSQTVSPPPPPYKEDASIPYSNSSRYTTQWESNA